ncbi:MAG: hypothetical protein JO264_04935 [Acidisphaera sp.]|nr:hypothetical protein [Acidisphaera sp.]
MDDRDLWRELEACQNQVTTLKAALGLLVGALRAIGVIGEDFESDFFALLGTCGRHAPTVDSEEWAATARLARDFAAAVTLRSGSIAFQP